METAKKFLTFTLYLYIGYVESKLFNLDTEGAGEIYSRGRGMFMGYLGDKEKTLQVTHVMFICIQLISYKRYLVHFF